MGGRSFGCMMPGMGWLLRFGTAMLLFGALAGCKGGEGEGCNSGGYLGPVYCDQGLTCNTADGYTCERTGSRQANQSCSSDDLCATGLWCAGSETCVPWLHEGDACNDPFSCGTTLACVHDVATGTTICGQPPPQPDGGVAGATVVGTLTLPGKPQGGKGTVALYTALPPAGTVVTETGFAATGSTSVGYQITGVPAGTYFILGFVDNDGSGGLSSTPGDYAGWYGHNGDGNPPAAANAVVPDSGTVRFDFSLVLR
ncbi:MAG TPA: hypothetical protein VLA79_19875 [Polyangia bacterium]|nr:hypothetical protein [Polyangia bacterium]